MADRLRILERRDIDELIILDIAATPNRRAPRFDEIKELCANLFCPITFGGGVKTVGDFRRLLAAGADKVAICTAAVKDPDLITKASRQFGAQAVIVAIDVKDGWAHIDCGKTKTDLDAVLWAQTCEDLGAGEILLNSIERDGMMQGYDLELIRRVSGAVSIPVIACGGCGDYAHMVDAMKAGAHAVAAGAFFQFKEATPKDAARYLNENGIATRL